MNSALFCLHESRHLLPKASLQHLAIAFWERLVQLQLEWPQCPHLVLLQLCPLPGGGVSEVKGMRPPRIHTPSPRPPTLDPRVSFQGCLSFLPRAVLP